MTTDQKLKRGDVVLYKKEYWLLHDWCKPCKKLWIQRFDKNKMVKYSDVKLMTFEQ